MRCIVIETPAYDANGNRTATFRHYVGEDEERAKAECAKVDGRTYRWLEDDQIPAVVRANRERAELTTS